MMPIAELSDHTNSRLQVLAEPLVDTHETVIARLLDHWDATKTPGPKVLTAGEPIGTLANGAMEFDPANPPVLTFTTPVQIVIGGKQLPKNETYWNTMMYQMISLVHESKKFDVETIHSMLAVANAVIGKKENDGYKFLPDVGLSVQGQDSNAAFRQAYHLAIFNGLKGSVFFNWQNNEKAAYPNQRGYMEF